MNTENDSNPGIEEVLQGDTEDTGIVIEVGDTTGSISRPLRRYALVKWAQIGQARIICEDSSWEKTEVLARASNV